MDKKVIKAVILTNPFFYNIFCYNFDKRCKCRKCSKGDSTIGSSDGESTDSESDNEDDKKKDQRKPKEKPEKTDKEKNKKEYIEKKKELRSKFEKYKNIIDGKESNIVSETVSKHQCGFNNYGCTCYFNSAMQQLIHNKELINAILDYVAGIADKSTIDIEIITLYYLIVKIYEKEQEREKTKDTPLIEEELGDLRYCIALKGIDIDKADAGRIDNFLNSGRQSDSAELLTSIIDDIRSIIDEENKEKEKKGTYQKNIIQNILCHEYFNGRVCTNNTCTDKGNNTKTFYTIFGLSIKNEPKGCENQLKDNLENSLKVTEDSELCKCDKCSVKKIEDYKKSNLKAKQQKNFKDCAHCKDYFEAIEYYNTNKEFPDKYKNCTDIEKKDGNIVTYRFFNDEEKKQQIAAFTIHNDSGLFFNQRCTECKKSFKDFWKDHIVEKKEVNKIKSTGNYFIIQNKRFENDWETGKSKKIENDINFEENLTLEPNKHGVEKNETFDLVGIICHRGTPDGGHYISYNKINGKWYLFDDKNVSEVPDNNILNVKYHDKSIQELNYILFYKKQ